MVDRGSTVAVVRPVCACHNSFNSQAGDPSPKVQKRFGVGRCARWAPYWTALAKMTLWVTFCRTVVTAFEDTAGNGAWEHPGGHGGSEAPGKGSANFSDPNACTISSS